MIKQESMSENVIVKFGTSKGQFLLVKVASDAIGFEVNKEFSCLIYTEFVSPNGITDTIKLPKGTYSILGLTSQLTEEQKEQITPMVYDGRDDGNLGNVPLYECFDGDLVCHNVKDSFASLLRSLKVYEKNPYGEPPKNVDADNAQWHFDYDQAQSRTGSWLLLKKIV